MIIVLTGTGSCGKSTLFNELRKEVPGKTWSSFEAPTEVIKRRLRNGRYLPWEREFNIYAWEGFEREIYNELLADLQRADINFETDTLIADRISEDILAYCKITGTGRQIWWQPTKSIVSFCKGAYNATNLQYKVFLLKPLHSVEDNNIRNLDWEIQNEYNTILETYSEFYNKEELYIEEYPMSVKERVEWVLNSIKN